MVISALGSGAAPGLSAGRMPAGRSPGRWSRLPGRRRQMQAHAAWASGRLARAEPVQRARARAPRRTAELGSDGPDPRPQPRPRARALHVLGLPAGRLPPRLGPADRPGSRHRVGRRALHRRSGRSGRAEADRGRRQAERPRAADHHSGTGLNLAAAPLLGTSFTDGVSPTWTSRKRWASTSLRARQDRGHQPVPQRSGERELHPGEFIQVHAVEATAWDN